MAITRPIPAPPTPIRSTQHLTDTHAAPPEANTDADASSTTVMIRPWIDPLVDETGHDPRSIYVERFWLGTLGPTATWVVRRLTAGLAVASEGYEVDLAVTARAMGLSFSASRSSPFSKALQRCTMFGLAHQTSDGFAIRRRLPTVAHRHLRRMPEAVQVEHERWHHDRAPADQFDRAHRLAMAMLDVGDGTELVEHQLVALGVDTRIAAAVADNATQL